jgi:hypothetical protein
MQSDQGGHEMRIKLLSLALAVAALAAPAAKAHHAPGEDVRASAPRNAAASPTPATIVKVVKPHGFEWGDAAVGGGVGAATAAVLFVLIVRLKKPRRLLALGSLGVLVLVPAALAGQPVTQTLTPPPPSFYTCMAVGSGTICHGTISGSSGPEETGLVCGSGTAFNAWQTANVDERAARYYNSDGNLTRRVLRDDVNGQFINPTTGTVVPWTQHEIHTTVLAVPGDFSSATETIVGQFVITVPHLGAVALEAGRVIQDANGNNEFRAGPQDFLDYYANGDTSAVEELCGALGAT